MFSCSTVLLFKASKSGVWPIRGADIPQKSINTRKVAALALTQRAICKQLVTQVRTHVY